MQSFIRGQRAKLAALSPRTASFYLQIVLAGAPGAVYDFVCFGLDARRQLGDDRYMIFFNQKSAPDRSILLQDLADQDAKFTLDLSAVPSHIEHLVFTASAEGAGLMRDLGESRLILGESGLAFPQELLEYRFTGRDFKDEGALMLAEIYRKEGQWRFWAQGQGFAGDLSALLAHFGGEEDGTAPVPTPSASTSPTLTPVTLPITPLSASPPQPSPPVSMPVVRSVPIPVASAAPNISISSVNALQKAILDAPRGGTVQLQRGEFQGPVSIDKPLTLEGGGAVVWAQNGPVIVVSSAGVTLRDLEIEVTASDEKTTHANVALWIAPGAATTLHSVRVRGDIEGVPGASGQWRLPTFLDLGEMAPRAENSFAVEVEVPHACEVKTNIAGVTLRPPRLQVGRARFEIVVAGVSGDTFLAGHLEFLSGGVGRTVPLSGRTAAMPKSPSRGTLLWSVDGL